MVCMTQKHEVFAVWCCACNETRWNERESTTSSIWRRWGKFQYIESASDSYYVHTVPEPTGRINHDSVKIGSSVVLLALIVLVGYQQVKPQTRAPPPNGFDLVNKAAGKHSGKASRDYRTRYRICSVRTRSSIRKWEPDALHIPRCHRAPSSITEKTENR